MQKLFNKIHFLKTLYLANMCLDLVQVVRQLVNKVTVKA